MRPFVHQVHLPKCIHLFQQFHVSCSNFQLFQSPHTGFESLRGFIAGLGLRRNEQSSVYAGLLLLESIGLLANSSIVIIGLGPRVGVFSSGIVKLRCF